MYNYRMKNLKNGLFCDGLCDTLPSKCWKPQNGIKFKGYPSFFLPKQQKTSHFWLVQWSWWPDLNRWPHPYRSGWGRKTIQGKAACDALRGQAMRVLMAFIACGRELCIFYLSNHVLYFCSAFFVQVSFVAGLSVCRLVQKFSAVIFPRQGDFYSGCGLLHFHFTWGRKILYTPRHALGQSEIK